ncbi:TauD/TfdA family dioxygenase [Streptomyces sp. NPDC000410]|uniref:TauD/TfdA family dioxygenase n=1 Tax=Streptomyces sp. NPDC000410 TaxID=3154254 RepID=UPI00331DD937
MTTSVAVSGTTDDSPRLWTLAASRPFGIRLTAAGAGTPLDAVPVPYLRDLVREHRIAVLRGFTPPAGASGLEGYARSWGSLLSWPFGNVFDVLAHEEPADHVFDTGFMPFHWDGMYREFIPEFQIFHCVEAPDGAEGGRTLFCDTTRVLAAAGPDTVDRWRSVTLGYRNRKMSHYGGVVVSPLIEPHPVLGHPVLRYLEPVPEGEHVINPPEVNVEGLDDPAAEAALLAALSAVVRDPAHLLAHRWQSDDIVVADNYTLLHTREPYRRGVPRHLRRVHVLGDPAQPGRLRPAEAVA